MWWKLSTAAPPSDSPFLAACYAALDGMSIPATPRDTPPLAGFDLGYALFYATGAGHAGEADARDTHRRSARWGSNAAASGHYVRV